MTGGNFIGAINENVYDSYDDDHDDNDGDNFADNNAEQQQQRTHEYESKQKSTLLSKCLQDVFEHSKIIGIPRRCWNAQAGKTYSAIFSFFLSFYLVKVL